MNKNGKLHHISCALIILINSFVSLEILRPRTFYSIAIYSEGVFGDLNQNSDFGYQTRINNIEALEVLDYCSPIFCANTIWNQRIDSNQLIVLFSINS